MGDFIFTHNEEGEEYFNRLKYLNILMYIVGACIVIGFLVGRTFLIFIVSMGLLAIIVYILYYIYKNPPGEYDAGPSPVFEES